MDALLFLLMVAGGWGLGYLLAKLELYLVRRSFFSRAACLLKKGSCADCLPGPCKNSQHVRKGVKGLI